MKNNVSQHFMGGAQRQKLSEDPQGVEEEKRPYHKMKKSTKHARAARRAAKSSALGALAGLGIRDLAHATSGMTGYTPSMNRWTAAAAGGLGAGTGAYAGYMRRMRNK